jgi:ABC-type multidrug transport system fused ATPase/permease subunit
MSRNWNKYDRDDLYDDEYDEYDEEGYYDEEDNGQDGDREEVVEIASDTEHNKSNAVSNTQFILESLNGIKGSKYSVSEATVTKMLKLYDYDPDRTLDYFLKQKSGEGAKSVATAKTDTRAAKADKQAPPAPKPKAATKPKKEDAMATTTKSDTLHDDLDAMGFKLDIKELSSDEDLSLAVTSDPSLQRRLTVVFAGHVDAGKSTLVGTLLRTYEAKSAKRSGESLEPLAWFTDESPSEREHGVTIGIAEK